MISANTGDIHPTTDGGVMPVRGEVMIAEFLWRKS
jgi:hypothetical protein